MSKFYGTIQGNRGAVGKKQLVKKKKFDEYIEKLSK